MSNAAKPPRDPDAVHYERLLAEAARFKGVSPWQDAWKRVRRNRAAMASLLFLGLLGAITLFTSLLPLQSPIRQDLETRQYLPPNIAPVSLGLRETLASDNPNAYSQRVSSLWYQPDLFDRTLIRLRVALFGDWCIPSICGTDNLGRDLLARLVWGGRVSLKVGLVATFVSLVIGVTYGSVAGYLGGVTDSVMMRFVDILYSIPFIFIVIFALTISNEESIKQTLLNYGITKIVLFYVLIGAIYWLTMARVVRGQVISLRNEQFVDAARVIGASTPRIIFLHLVPNVLSIVIMYLTLTIPSVILYEAFLSFLGMGVEPPEASWGALASDGIRAITSIRIYWWLVVFPGLALALTLLALNFLGDGLRDALDPRLRNR